MTLPLATSGPVAGWILAIVLSISSVANLVMLARSKRFERFVYFLIGCGPAFVLVATVLTGGVTHSPDLVWASLVPACAS